MQSSKDKGEIKMQNFYKAVNAMWEGKKKGAQYTRTPEDFLIARITVSANTFNLCVCENMELTSATITSSIRIYFSDVGACLCNLCKDKFWLRQNCCQRCCSEDSRNKPFSKHTTFTTSNPFWVPWGTQLSVLSPPPQPPNHHYHSACALTSAFRSLNGFAHF